MEVKYETKVEIDGEVVYSKEVTIHNGDKNIIKAAILAALKECSSMCEGEIGKTIDDYQA